jgi:hypothetical protein
MILISSVNFPSLQTSWTSILCLRQLFIAFTLSNNATWAAAATFSNIHGSCNPVYCDCHQHPSQLNMEVWLDNKNKYEIAINFLLYHLRLIPKFDAFLLSQ